MKKSRLIGWHNRKENGVVLIEFAFVLPLLLLFIVGIYEIGRYFSQVSWIANTAFQTASVGAANAEGDQAKVAMRERYNQLVDLQATNSQRGIFGTDPMAHASPLAFAWDNASDVTVSPTYGADNMVHVQIEADFDSLWTGILELGFPINVTVSAPILVSNAFPTLFEELARFSSGLKAIFDDHKRFAEELKQKGHNLTSRPAKRIEKKTGTTE